MMLAVFDQWLLTQWINCSFNIIVDRYEPVRSGQCDTHIHGTWYIHHHMCCRQRYWQHDDTVRCRCADPCVGRLRCQLVVTNHFHVRQVIRTTLVGSIPWGHSGPLCHALSLQLLLWTSILHCHSPGVATAARRLRYSYSWLRLILSW